MECNLSNQKTYIAPKIVIVEIASRFAIAQTSPDWGDPEERDTL